MKVLPVSAKIGKDGTPVTINYPMGESLAEIVEQYGEDIIFNHAKSSIVVALQGFMRSRIDPDREGGALSQEALQQEIDGDGTEENPGWKPGTRQPGKSAAEKVREQISKMDPELRKALLAELAGGGDDVQDDGSDAEEEPAPAAQARGSRRARG